MSNFELTFEIDGMTDEVIEQVYSQYDALVAEHGDVTLLTITGTGSSAASCAKRMVTEIEAHQNVVVRSCHEDLVSRADIAERCGISPQGVGNWILGKRHKLIPFPRPYNLVSGGIWLWSEVNEWLRKSSLRHDEVCYPSREDYAEINRWISEHRVGVVGISIDFAFSQTEHKSNKENRVGKVRYVQHPMPNTVVKSFEIEHASTLGRVS